jgi:hypothetical protein
MSDQAQEFAVVFTSTNPSQVDVARIILEDHDIRCEVSGEHQSGFAGVLPIQILVPTEQANTAVKLLSHLQDTGE